MDSKKEGITGDSTQEVDTSINSPFFAQEGVKECKDGLLKERLKTLINQRGMSEPDFYNLVGLSRQHWYFLSWGLWNCPIEIKLKIAKALGTDSGLIWQESKK